MKVSEAGLALIKSFEGFATRPYWDVDAWAIGYGSRKGVTRSTPPVTPAQASARLRAEVDEDYAPAIDRLDLPLNQNQYDALCSATFNLGTGLVDARTGIGQALRRQDWQAAADELLKWDKAGGRPLAGLTRRRLAERALFLTPVVVVKPLRPADWLSVVELRRVRELDAIRAGRIAPAHPRREAVLVRVLVEQRRRIWRAAQQTGWDKLHRRKRYASLLARTR